ncbi:MAG: beta-ketoacyl-ACP synthase [Leptolyngbyaceae cyanobacterium SM2_5_2]|nr:beta-ketoacyl-ACP synthase [Leptolyngbyaceae cyanobacterium SM2_5_2]
MVLVTGLGAVTALGASLPLTWERLLAGKSGLSQRQPFPELPELPLGMVGHYPQSVGNLLAPAVAEAISDAGLVPPLLDCGVVIGSSRSFQGVWESWAKDWLTMAALPPGEPWLGALPHMAAVTTARQLGATGPVLAPMAACATGLLAIAQGCSLIRRGQCAQVLVGAVEAPITALTLAGFQQLGALATTGCYPFSATREGLVLGEGAAILVLESEEALRQRSGVEPYGQILGDGFSTDAYHRTAPDPRQGGSRAALKACLHRSGLMPHQVDYVHAHGTATQLNDAHEARLISQELSHLPAVSSTKAATGHTLGASGALGAAFCLLALRHQWLPPNTGQVGQGIYPSLVPESRSARINAALCLSFGFGGQNAALAMGRHPTSEQG